MSVSGTNQTSRRTVLKLMAAAPLAGVLVACESLPRGQVGSITDGKELSNAVRDALRNDPSTAQLSVDISSSDDSVMIKGLVPNKSDFHNVELVANRVPGVRIAIVDVYWSSE